MKELCGDEACEEVVVPGGGFALEAEGVLAGGFTDQVVGHVLEGGEVGGSVLGSDAAFVVAEDHVHDPVEAVLDCPMTADHGSELACQPRQRGDVEARLPLDFVGDFARAIDHDNALQSRPIVALLEPRHIMDRGVGSGLDAAVIAVDGLMPADLGILPSRPGELRPEPLTDSGRDTLASSGSCHQAKAAAFRRELELLLSPVDSLPTLVTRPLCSTGITPFQRYYEAVRPSPAHRYFRPRGVAACAFSLGIAGQVLKFRTKARMRVTPPIHRTPHGQ